MKKLVAMLLCMILVFSCLAQTAFAYSAYGYESDESLEDECGIEFDANGGSGTMVPLWMNGNFKLPECEFTAPEGQQFRCWQINRENKNPGDSIYLGSHLVAKAIWEPIPAAVVFEGGGGDGTMDAVEITGEYTLPECGFAAPEGQQFLCWLVDGAQMQPGDTIQVNSVMTVTAQWEVIPVTEPATEPEPEPETAPPTVGQDVPEQNTDAAAPGQDAPTDDPVGVPRNTLIVAIALVAVAVVVMAGMVVIVVVKKKKA